MDNWTLKAIQLISRLLAPLGLGLKRDFDLRLAEQKSLAEIQLQQELAQASAQIADDIRGPLMALTTLTHLSHEMGADKKELLKVAVGRIRGIVNDLVQAPADETSDLVTVIEPLLKEYKFSNPSTQWALHNHLSSAQVPVDLDTVQLQRVLSHLLDNAVEAVPENQSSIEVTLMERADHYLLQIMDNGCGIPEDLLPKVAEEGVSHGKEKRHGLGLFEARKTIEALGGELQIRSREGVGTQVILLFPKKFKSEEALVM
ncbi:hypothetical protein AZI86_18500 [Bdellovibrio bacteriovorus]|uniref:histidine kinase n=1 Tax=Bdellovibrio bacteriovorus TaxID=959 RepID=A0A150WF80_BDEBC|nr:sensor histidine kinase [Bdellovibrio bacteriovorus]KYG61686.1 hypothetical protein AZI86_18500 [Bdellovibrio bacteriovorus]